MEWIKIIEFSINETLEVNKFYFLYDADAKLVVNGENIQIAPTCAMYKGGGKFIGEGLTVLLIEDYTHAVKFEPPKET